MRNSKLLVVSFALAIPFSPACKCNNGLLGGNNGVGGEDDFDSRFNAYRGAAGNAVKVCPGQEVTLGAADFGDVTYSWEPSIFLSDPTSARPIFQSNQPGNYIYTLTITDSQGRQVPSGITVSVVSPPGAIIR